MSRKLEVLTALFITAAVLAQVATAPHAPTLEHVSNSNAPLDPISEALAVRAYEIVDLAVPSDLGRPFSIDIPLGDAVQSIQMAPRSLRGDGFRVLLADERGTREIEPPPPSTFRGTLDGSPVAWAAASLSTAGLHAIIRTCDEEGTIWNVTPLSHIVPGSERTKHVVHRDSDSIQPAWECPVEGAPPTVPPQVPALPGGPRDIRVCEVAIDTDYWFYTNCQYSEAQMLWDIEYHFNAVNAIYEQELAITHQVVFTILRTTPAPNPYTESDIYKLGAQFQAYWLANYSFVHRDVAHLFTGSTPVGGAGWAFIPGICSIEDGYGLSNKKFYFDIGWSRTMLIAHELGHNWNAVHCDSYPPCGIMCSTSQCPGGGGTLFDPISAVTILAYANGKPCVVGYGPPPVAPAFYDGFEDPYIYGWWWTANSGCDIVSDVPGSPTQPYVLRLEKDDSISTAPITTSDAPLPLWVSFDVAWGGGKEGRVLQVDYFSPSANLSKPLASLVAGGSAPTGFEHHEFALGADAIGDGFYLRFHGEGPNGPGVWYLDDIGVERGATAQPFYDDFSGDVVDRDRWARVYGATLYEFGSQYPSASGPPRIRLDSNDEITTGRIDTAALGAPLWIQYAVAGTDPAATLSVEYYSEAEGRFVVLEQFVGTSGPVLFKSREFAMPADGYGSNFRLRFRRTEGLSFSSWLIDDVRVDGFCRADIEQDGDLDVFDFLAFQGAWAGQTFIGDYENDGDWDVFDFLAFQGAYSSGCY